MRLLQLGCGASLFKEFLLTSEKNNEVESEAPGQSGDSHGDADQNAVPFAAESQVCVNGGENNCAEQINGVGAKSTSSGVTGTLNCISFH